MSPSTPIRVLQVLHRMDYGGIESWLMGVLRLADPAHVHLDFLVHGPPGAHEAEIVRLGGGIIRGGDPHRPRAYRQRLLEVLREHGPYRVVHSHLHLYSGVVLRAAADARVPVRIAHSHNVTPQERGLLRRFYAWGMRRWIRRHATVGLAASSAAVANLYGPAADPRWQVLLYGLDLAPFRQVIDRGALRRQLGIPADARVVGHVGRLVTQKNHELVLRIAAALPEAWFLLVGDGELRPQLERRAAELGIADRTVFAGARGDVAALLKSMDVFLFPSHFEGLGLAVVEAQAAGVPVVTADTTPAEALVVPWLCSVLPLSAPIERWASTLRCARRPEHGDPLAEVAASPFDQQAGFMRLMALYGGAP
jgi:glycosyltransferase involved in cell wall biosynthesis